MREEGGENDGEKKGREREIERGRCCECEAVYNYLNG
jgi:hypothetical protein